MKYIDEPSCILLKRMNKEEVGILKGLLSLFDEYFNPEFFDRAVEANKYWAITHLTFYKIKPHLESLTTLEKNNVSLV